jgi:muconate cycloisomerase
MKITGLEFAWVKVPLMKEYHVLSRTYQFTSHIMVRMHTDDGPTGIAETMAQFAPEAMMIVLKDFLGPAVIGMDPRQPDLLHQQMDRILPDQYQAKCGIDLAAYDAWGKASGMSVAALLGGQHRDKVPVCDVIGLLPPEEVRQAAREILDKGFKQVKLKAGREFARDLETVEAVRDACGNDLQIRIDINTGYRNAAVALPLCKRLEEAGVDIFEQPILGRDLDGMALLADQLSAPVLAHESLATVDDAVAIIERKSADILNVSPPKAGGMFRAMQIVRLAEAANIPVMIAGANENGVGNVASAHLGAACREQPFPGDARTVLRASETLVREPIVFEAGHVHLPEGSGLGLTLDEEAIDRCRQTPWVKIGHETK